MRTRFLRFLLCLILCPAPANAAPREVQQRVAEALAHYDSGDYAAAAQALAHAEAILPDDPRILFGIGATLAAEGESERAEALLQKAAMSDDPEIAPQARYNLGCMAAQRARTLFGSRPEDASDQTRRRGLDLLDQAAGHYRDCLNLDQNHVDARHNLEVVRLWAARMRSAWSIRDRLKQASQPTPNKTPPKQPPTPDSASRGPAGQHPGEEGKKLDRSAKSGEDKQRPPEGGGRLPVNKEQNPPPASVGDDFPQDQSERLFSKVRERSQVKRQWDQQHAPNRLEEPEAKDW